MRVMVALRSQARWLCAALACLFLSACVTGNDTPVRLETTGAPLETLQAINEQIRTCWMRRHARSFAGVSAVPELDTTGTRRILFVRKPAPNDRPVMVITAAPKPEGGMVLEVFGALLGTDAGNVVRASALRWQNGNYGCA